MVLVRANPASPWLRQLRRLQRHDNHVKLAVPPKAGKSHILIILTGRLGKLWQAFWCLFDGTSILMHWRHHGES